jgi:hypothetical protein
MIAALAVCAHAYDGVPQWDDPVVDRAPREQTVSLAQGFAFGPTTLSNTRLQLGLTPYSRDRFGLGLTASVQLNGVVVGAEDRASAGLGTVAGDLHIWFAPRKRTRTSHDLFVGLNGATATQSYLVRMEDSFTAIRLGYSGYYEASDTVDVSFDARGYLGSPPAGYAALGASGNLTIYGSPDKERWVLLGGVDGSVTTVAALVGARARFGPTVEAGAAVVVPVYTLNPLRGELPLWPVIDLRARF